MQARARKIEDRAGRSTYRKRPAVSRLFGELPGDGREGTIRVRQKVNRRSQSPPKNVTRARDLPVLLHFRMLSKSQVRPGVRLRNHHSTPVHLIHFGPEEVVMPVDFL